MQTSQFVIATVILGLVAASLVVWRSIFRGFLTGCWPVAYEPRKNVPWAVADLLLLIFCWLLIEGGAVQLAGGRGDVDSGEFSTSLLVAIVVARLLWMMLAVAYLVVRVGATAQDLGWDFGRAWSDVRLGVLAFLAALTPVYGIQAVVSYSLEPPDHPLAKWVQQHPDARLLALASVSAVVVAPLTEELLFRLILQGWVARQVHLLRRRGNRLRGLMRATPILVSATLFSAVHQGYDRIALFVLALFLGYLYQRTHRILPSMVLHACINASAIVQLWLGVG